MERLRRPLSSLKVETLVGGVTGWEVGRVLVVGGGGGELVGESGGYVELSYCRQRARAGNAQDACLAFTHDMGPYAEPSY